MCVRQRKSKNIPEKEILYLWERECVYVCDRYIYIYIYIVYVSERLHVCVRETEKERVYV